MDPRTRTKLHNRLRRVGGQVQGVARMLDEGEECVDLLLQLSAIQGAVGKIRQILLRHHVESCLVDAFEHGDEHQRASSLDDLLEVVLRHSSR